MAIFERLQEKSKAMAKAGQYGRMRFCLKDIIDVDQCCSLPPKLEPDAADLNDQVDLDQVFRTILTNLLVYSIALPCGLWCRLATAIIESVDDARNTRLVKLSLILNASRSTGDMIMWMNNIENVCAENQFFEIPEETHTIMNAAMFQDKFDPFVDGDYNVIAVSLPRQTGPMSMEGWVCLNNIVAVSDVHTEPKNIVQHFALANILCDQFQHAMWRKDNFKLHAPDIDTAPVKAKVLESGNGLELRVWGCSPCWTAPREINYALELAQSLFADISANKEYVLSTEVKKDIKFFVGEWVTKESGSAVGYCVARSVFY